MEIHVQKALGPELDSLLARAPDTYRRYRSQQVNSVDIYIYIYRKMHI